MLYFIANETARTGKGVSVWKQVQAELKEKNITYKAFKTEHKNHAAELAGKICELEDDDICIVVVGGDGTLNEVINGITDFDKVRIGLIPAGSGNDFARELAIGRNPRVCLERILDCTERGREACVRIDLGQAEWPQMEKARLYAISSGVGMDALVCKKMFTSKIKTMMNRLRLSKISYLIVTVQSLISMETSDITVKTDEDIYNFKRSIFAAAMNAKAEGGGVPMAPKAGISDGLLSVCVVHKYTKLGALLRIPFLAVGKHEHFSGVSVLDSKKIDISLKKPMTLHTDGEYMGEVTEVSYSCLAGKMRFML